MSSTTATFSREKLKKVFEQFDIDENSGVLSRSEAMCALTLLFPGSSPAVLFQKISSLDANKDGNLSLEEFYALSSSFENRHQNQSNFGITTTPISTPRKSTTAKKEEDESNITSSAAVGTQTGNSRSVSVVETSNNNNSNSSNDIATITLLNRRSTASSIASLSSPALVGANISTSTNVATHRNSLINNSHSNNNNINGGSSTTTAPFYHHLSESETPEIPHRHPSIIIMETSSSTFSNNNNKMEQDRNNSLSPTNNFSNIQQHQYPSPPSLLSIEKLSVRKLSSSPIQTECYINETEGRITLAKQSLMFLENFRRNHTPPRNLRLNYYHSSSPTNSSKFIIGGSSLPKPETLVMLDVMMKSILCSDEKEGEAEVFSSSSSSSATTTSPTSPKNSSMKEYEQEILQHLGMEELFTIINHSSPSSSSSQQLLQIELSPFSSQQENCRQETLLQKFILDKLVFKNKNRFISNTTHTSSFDHHQKQNLGDSWDLSRIELASLVGNVAVVSFVLEKFGFNISEQEHTNENNTISNSSSGSHDSSSSNDEQQQHPILEMLSSLLYFAVAGNSFDLVDQVLLPRILLEKSKNSNLVSEMMNRALIIGSSFLNIKICKLLIEKGGADINHCQEVNHGGNTTSSYLLNPFFISCYQFIILSSTSSFTADQDQAEDEVQENTNFIKYLVNECKLNENTLNLQMKSLPPQIRIRSASTALLPSFVSSPSASASALQQQQLISPSILPSPSAAAVTSSTPSPVRLLRALSQSSNTAAAAPTNPASLLSSPTSIPTALQQQQQQQQSAIIMPPPALQNQSFGFGPFAKSTSILSASSRNSSFAQNNNNNNNTFQRMSSSSSMAIMLAKQQQQQNNNNALLSRNNSSVSLNAQLLRPSPFFTDNLPRRNCSVLSLAVTCSDGQIGGELLKILFSSEHQLKLRSSDSLAPTCLSLAVQSNSVECLKLLLSQTQEQQHLRTYLLESKDTSSDDGCTPIFYAASNKELAECCEILCQNGANVNVQNSDGMTPLMYAVAARQKKAVAILLKYGADPTIKMNITLTTTSHDHHHGKNDYEDGEDEDNSPPKFVVDHDFYYNRDDEEEERKQKLQQEEKAKTTTTTTTIVERDALMIASQLEDPEEGEIIGMLREALLSSKL